MGFDITKNVKFVLAMAGEDVVKNATKGVTDGFLSADKAISMAKSALLGLAGIASVNVFKDMVMGVIDATGKLHDLSIQSGMSVAALAQFKGVGAYTQTAIEDIVGASNKLSKSLAGQNEESKGAAQAIAALGLDFNKFKALSPEQQMLDLAKAMNRFEDGSGKSAAAMMLLGKEGARMLPYLKDLAEEAARIEAALTDQEKATKAAQAAMADAFGDNLTALRKNGEGWRKDMALGLMPALYEASDALKAMMGGTGGLREQIHKLAADGTLAGWARGAMVAFSYLIDVGQGLFTVIPMIGKAIAGLVAGTSAAFGAVFEAFDKLKSGDLSGAWDALKAGVTGVRTVAAETAADISNLWGQKLLGQTFRDRMADIEGVGVAAQDVKPKLNLAEPLEKTDKAAKAAHDSMVGLVGKIGELIAQQTLQLTTGDKLTASDKLRIDVMAKLTGGQLEAALAALKVADAQADLIANAKAEEQAVAALYKVRQQEAEQAQRRADDLVGQVQRQEEENLRLGMTADAYAQLEMARLKDQQRLADLAVQQDEYLGLCNAETEAHRQTAQALGDLVAAKEQNVYLQGAQAAVAAWKSAADAIGSGITNALMDAFSTGGNFFEKLWHGIVATFRNTTLNLAVNAVQNGITSLVQGAGSAAINGYKQTGTLMGGANSVYQYGSGLFGSGATYGAGTTTMAGSAAYGGAAAEVTGAEGVGAAGGGSMAAYAGYAALIYAAVKQGEADYAKGHNRAQAEQGENALIGGNAGEFTPTAFTAWWMDKLGLNEKWTSILSGSTMVARGMSDLGLIRTQHQGSVVGVDAAGNASTLMGDSSQITANYSEGLDGALRVLASTSTGMVKDLDALFGNTGTFTAVAKFASDGHDPSIGQFALQNNGTQIGYVGNGADYARYADDAATALDAYANDVARATRDALNTLALPQWAKDQIDGAKGELDFKGLSDLVGDITRTQGALKSMGEALLPLGGAFGRVAAASSDAQFDLAALAGGIDALRSKAAGYVANYYTADEQAAITAVDLMKQMAAVGIDASVATRMSDLRTLMDTLNPNAAEDRAKMVALLNVQAEYAPVGQYLEENQMTLGELASQAPQTIAALEAIRTPTELTADATQQTAASTAVVADAAQQTATAVTEIAAATTEQTDAIETGMGRMIALLTEVAARLTAIDRALVHAEAAT